MKLSIRFGVLVAAAATTVTYGWLKSYEVEPVKAEWSGTAWGDPQFGVGEIITCNFDSAVAVHLFVGYLGANPSRPYKVDIYEYPGGVTPVAYNLGVVASKDHDWLIMPLTSEPGQKFVSGKRYLVKFTRPGDSIHCYYNPNDPYAYGGFVAPDFSDSIVVATTDLCMRVYGVMDRVDSTWWGMLIWARDTVAAYVHNLHGKVESAGVHIDRIDLPWDWVWRDSTQEFDFSWLDPAVIYSHNTMHCKIIGILDYCAPWASTLNDSGDKCPPRNLFLDVWHPSNYWARYVEGVVRHYYSDLGLVDIYEIWNEPNDTGRFWKIPEFHYTISDTVHDLCYLYARLCQVAATVIDSVTNGQATVLVGSLVAMQPSVKSRIRPGEMLEYCYRLADRQLWDGVSIHPYQDDGFNLDLFEKQAETLRTVMRENGDYGKLWITEIGWPSDVYGAERQANWLCEAFVAAKGSEALPGGGYDQMCYYSFLDRDGEHFGILDNQYQRKPSFYAIRQVSQLLFGKRFNSRMLLGDARDDSVRIYEFEKPSDGKRTWVCWQNQPPWAGGVPPQVYADLPVRTDTLPATLLAYDSTPPSSSKTAETDGWLPCTLGTRPVFVSEVTDALRPDLRVESTAVFPREPEVGQPMLISAWIKNIGNRATPQRLSTLVVFIYKGVTLGQVVYSSVIQPGEVVCVEYYFVPPAEMGGHCLITAVANPDQGYVELAGLDDNRGYKRVYISPSER